MPDWLAQITLGEIFLATLATICLRELAVASLPDRIAGPGGWLVDTRHRLD